VGVRAHLDHRHPQQLPESEGSGPQDPHRIAATEIMLINCSCKGCSEWRSHNRTRCMGVCLCHFSSDTLHSACRSVCIVV